MTGLVIYAAPKNFGLPAKCSNQTPDALHIDLLNNLVWRDGKPPAKLSHVAVQMLIALVSGIGEPVSARELAALISPKSTTEIHNGFVRLRAISSLIGVEFRSVGRGLYVAAPAMEVAL